MIMRAAIYSALMLLAMVSSVDAQLRVRLRGQKPDGGGGATAAIQTSQADTTDATTYTFSNVAIGTAASDRYVAFFIVGRRFASSTCSLSSATINGGAATVNATQSTNNGSGNCSVVALVYLTTPITTGTTATVAATFAGAFVRAAVTPVRLTGVTSAAPPIITSSTANDPTWSTTIMPSGVSAAVVVSNGTPTDVTWTGLTESFDAVVEGSTRHSGAILTPTTLQNGITTTADVDIIISTSDSAGLRAVWAPIGPAHATKTHEVTTNGSGSSNCFVGDPCTLTRAFAIAGGAFMPPGSFVELAAGDYDQAAISTTGGGASGFPIRMVGQGTSYTTGTRIHGTRTSFPAASWSLCAGQTYTYCATFDESTNYTVGLFAQRPTASTWVPIEVDDRASPFSTGSFRAFTLDEPVSYSPRFSTADVEAQHCTFWHDTSNNLLKIHPCREGAPSDADLYYGGPADWGTFNYTGSGDYLTLEQVSISHTTNQGIDVANSATGVQLKHIKALAAQVWLRGVGTIAEDLLIKEVYDQGPVDANCYSAQYGGGGLSSRSCWNDAGGGYQLLIGEQDTGFAYNQTLNRVTLERGWNGYRLDGPNTLSRASCWGFANHCGQATGTGAILEHGTFSNSQDSLYLEGESFENFTIRRNLFRNGVLVWSSRDGATSGDTTPPTTWSFTGNILGSLVVDELTDAAGTGARVGDCNVWIPRASGSTLYRRTQVDGSGSDPQYTSLATIISGTNDEDNAITYPFTAYTDGSIFANHTNQEQLLDFSLAAGGAAALTVCGVRAGPDNLP